MSFVQTISLWQQEATTISPPVGTGLLRAVGGLQGPAFFPEGFGLTDAAREENQRPTVMAIGHNFGCAQYRDTLQSTGREDDKATWRNLDSLIVRAGASPDDCFRTNWFIGLLPGEKQTGIFLKKDNDEYENACLSLLIRQTQIIRPTAILFLGPEVAKRAYRLIPALLPWRNAKRWSDIDRSSIGHSLRNVEVSSTQMETNVAALLHPSFGTANQNRRMKNMPKPMTEVEIVRSVLGA